MNDSSLKKPSPVLAFFILLNLICLSSGEAWYYPADDELSSRHPRLRVPPAVREGYYDRESPAKYKLKQKAAAVEKLNDEQGW